MNESCKNSTEYCLAFICVQVKKLSKCIQTWLGNCYFFSEVKFETAHVKCIYIHIFTVYVCVPI